MEPPAVQADKQVGGRCESQTGEHLGNGGNAVADERKLVLDPRRQAARRARVGPS